MDPAPSTSRDRVRDGPMTYNVECAIHTILAVRQVYPPDVFVRRKRYEAPAFQSRHPGLNEYIGTTCNAIVHELQHVRLPLTQSSLRQVVIALLDEDAPGADHVLERYVFALDFLLPDTDMRNRDLIAATAGRRTTYVDQAHAACTFRVLIEMDADQTPSANSDREPATGPWAPADGVPFQANAADDAHATLGVQPAHPHKSVPQLHPLQVLESGVSLHVEAYADVGAGASQATSHDTQEAAQSQRDLDDPDIEHGASTSVIPLRKRKLFAQPVTTGGPMSDASSAESGDESDDSGQSLSAPH
ncbi:hypothetical protein CBS14141_002510 [Malassezia furfur]|nr:hypothetical protein CBS14141_002510 [Malassezia furfur]